MKLIIGLGNPGKQYEKTRHNIGFVAVDALRKKLTKECDIGDWELSKKFNAEICGCSFHGEKIILAKPMTFMNQSGEAVQLIAHFHSIAPHDIIIAHDDKDLALGNIRVHADRGHAGHNGVKSIMDHIGSRASIRVRLGIASENKKQMQDTADFVLGKFGLTEKKKVKDMAERAAEEIKKLLVHNEK